MKHDRVFRSWATCFCALAFAAQAQISVGVAPDTVFLGEQFNVSGAGFTPSGVAILHFAVPSGAELPTMTMIANAGGIYNGTATISSSSSNLPTGLYRHWAVDQSTGTRSADVFLTVTPAHVIVVPRATRNKFDNDGNGYYEEVTLEIATYASSGFHRIDAKFYGRDCHGQEALTISRNNLPAALGPGNVFTIKVPANSQRELWDFRMEAFVSGSTDSLVYQIPYEQSSEWTSLPMWDGTPACVSAALFPAAAGETALLKPLTAYLGDTLCIDIRLAQNPQPIDTFACTVQVDPQRLVLARVAKGDLTGGFTTVHAEEFPAGSGTILCSGSGAIAVPANSTGSVLRLCFTVQCLEGELGEIVIKDLLRDFAGLGVCCNAFVCAACESNGDLNHDASLTPGDALCAFQIYLNNGALPPGCGAAEIPCELVAADVNCDGTTTPGDALAIFQRYLQNLPPAPCFAKINSSANKARPAAYQLVLQPRRTTSPLAPSPRELMKVALRVEQNFGLEAFGLALSYPTDKLEFMRVERTTLTADWVQLEGRENVPGVITLAGFTTQPMRGAASSEVLEIVFAHNGRALEPEEFVVSALVDDFREAGESGLGVRRMKAAELPKSFLLEDNFPNPFNPETEIRFALPQTSHAVVKIFNLLGEEVRTLVDEHREAGYHTLSWEGRDNFGKPVASGVYLYQLRAGGFSQVKRMSLLR